MSEHDRGAYTPPTDEPLSFDARRPQGRRPMPMTLVASVIGSGRRAFGARGSKASGWSVWGVYAPRSWSVMDAEGSGYRSFESAAESVEGNRGPAAGQFQTSS